MLRFDDAWIWDSWSFDDGTRHHLYYLQAPRMPQGNMRHDKARIGHAVSEDLRSWDVLGETFGPAGTGAFDDLATWTGSVISAGDGSYRLFYTAISTAGHGLRDQRLGMASSTDLHTWTGRSTAPIAAPDRRWYKTLADYPDVATAGPDVDTVSETWRDPYAVRDPKGDGWHLLVTARAAGAERNDDGVVAHLHSPDLETWTVLPPLSSPGTGFGQLEVLQTRELDGRWVLVFTCHPQEMTPERVARGGEFCTWSVPCEGPLGPFDIDAARPFAADPTLFAAPLVQQRDGTWAILGFHNLEDRGGESFEICDPVPVTLDDEGYLVARAEEGQPLSSRVRHRPVGHRFGGMSGSDDASAWWRKAVMYQVYLRSFADGNGDGEGDLPGLRARLPYLADLGVDGLWISPWFPSPMADGGYDVSDFRGIHPMFGTLEDADAVLRESRALGLRVIIDLVPNHTSDQHPWFLAALAAEPGSPVRDRYFFRDGRGPDGDEPPNNWISAFGGSAWARVTEPHGRPGQWYLHLFAPEQPDLNWTDPTVLDDFDDVLRFWFDRGVDGLRIDAAPAMAKKAGLPDADYGGVLQFRTVDWDDNPHWDVEQVHDIFRRWRAIADTYDGDRAFVAEAVVSTPERLAKYLRPDEMHTAFNFPYLKGPWDAETLREVIDATLASFEPVGVPSTWVLTSHDEIRPVTRYGRPTTSSFFITDGEGEVSDLALGTRRARAAAMLMLALPGGAYIYQGEELGLPNVDDLPDEVLQDPMFLRSGGAIRGRDGCRVPLPWSGAVPPFGFSPDGVQPWLPQPECWSALTVEAESSDEGSMLSLYRAALRLRRSTEGLHAAPLAWRESPSGVLDFDRGTLLRCVVNLSQQPVEFTVADVLLTSAPLAGGRLPVDAAAWLRPQAE